MSCGFVFPGQGSQTVGMLRDFIDEPVVRKCFDTADAAIGIGVRKLVLDGPEADLNRTELTQPALLTASVALWRLWQDRGGASATVLAGHSLGEYSALVAADAIDFADAVRLVHLRGRLMQSAVPVGAGAMAAILGLDEVEVAKCCAAVDGIVAPANINAPGQVVIAGATAAVDAAIEGCSAAGAKRAIKLAVSVPSHCPLMAPIAAEFGAALDATRVVAPRIPVVQNVDAESSGAADRIRSNLVAQLSSPVRWTQCVEAMVRRGATTLLECGPGNVLAALIKRIDRSVKVHTIGVRAAFDAALVEVGRG
ncbi:MAG TPA: ACP S-malonyltransferase [Pseudomonadales bacterium]|nr:ACP S-malonyltransferase [Pseudomonadales bacterium]